MDDPKDPLHEQLQRLLTAVAQAEAQPEYFNTTRGLADLRKFIETALRKSAILRQQEAALESDKKAHDDRVDSVLKKVEMAVEATGVREAFVAMKRSLGNIEEANKSATVPSEAGEGDSMRGGSTNLNEILPGIVEDAVARAFQNPIETMNTFSKEGKTVIAELMTKLELLVESKQTIEDKSTQLSEELKMMKADRDHWEKQASLKEATLAREKKARERRETELRAMKKDIATSGVIYSSAKEQQKKRPPTSSLTTDEELRQHLRQQRFGQ